MQLHTQKKKKTTAPIHKAPIHKAQTNSHYNKHSMVYQYIKHQYIEYQQTINITNKVWYIIRHLPNPGFLGFTYDTLMWIRLPKQ